MSEPSRAPIVDPGAVSRLRQRRIEQTSAMYRGVMRRALEGKASPRQAIKAFCLHCVGDVRERVTDCTAYACPLYQYRPYRREEGE